MGFLFLVAFFEGMNRRKENPPGFLSRGFLGGLGSSAKTNILTWSKQNKPESQKKVLAHGAAACVLREGCCPLDLMSWWPPSYALPIQAGRGCGGEWIGQHAQANPTL